MITKDKFIDELSHCEIHLLQETLFRSKIEDTDTLSQTQCAELIANELWKRTQTLWERSFSPKSLDEIVDFYTNKLELDCEGDAYQQLDELLLTLLPESSVISLEEIPDSIKEDFMQSPWVSRFGYSGGFFSIFTSFISKFISGQLHRIPFWLLRIIPWIGPKIILVRNAANVIAIVSGPLGIAISLYTIYQKLGPKWDIALPLLLGSAIALHHNKKPVPIEI
jgi:hypothetical protein